MAAATTEANGKKSTPRSHRRVAGVALSDLPRDFLRDVVTSGLWKSFVFNIYNLQSISVFATAPLMLALGQTFVIISAGIDLSSASSWGSPRWLPPTANYFALKMGLGPFPAMLLAILAGTAVAFIPGLVNGWMIAHLQVPAFIGTWHVWCGSRFGLSPGWRHDRSGFQSLVRYIGNGRVLGVPVLVIIVAIAC